MTSLQNKLQEFGLNEREARTYVSLLELGESTVLPLAQKAGLQRTYVYDILEGLIKKGLVTHYEKRGRRRYVAEDPKQLGRLLRERVEHFEELLPELRSVYNYSPTKPKVRFYEGMEGITAVYEELLKEKWYDNVGGSDAFIPGLGSYGKDLGDRIVKAGICTRELVSLPTSQPLVHTRLYKKPLQEIRFLPEGVSINTDLLICQDRAFLISFDKEIHAVLIEASGIVNTLKVMFEQMWSTTAPIEEGSNAERLAGVAR